MNISDRIGVHTYTKSLWLEAERMKRWLRFVGIGLVVTILAGALALAHGTPSGPGRGQAAVGRLVGELGITQEQAAKIRAILTAPDGELDRLLKAVKIAKLHLSLALEENAAEDELTARLKEYEAAVKPGREYQAARVRKALDVLTVKQRCKLAVMGREDWWRLFMGRPGGNGRGGATGAGNS
jgi:Spy/CpxP family protein refolding chaperone